MILRNIFNRIHFLSAIVASTCLALQLIVITVNVILRYGFSSGISWMEEISKDVFMTAFTFLSMAIGVKLDLHVNVNILPRSTPPWVDTTLRKFKYIVLSVVGLVLAYYGILLLMGIRARIASIPILPAWLQFVMMPLAGVLITVDSAMNLLGMKKDDHYLDDIFMQAGRKSG